MLAFQDVCPSCLLSIHQSVEEVEDDLSDEVPEQEEEEKTIEEESDHRALWTTLIVALVVLLALVFIGLYVYRHTQERNERLAYENAINSTEPAVLQNFLDIYTAALPARRDSVKTRLEKLREVDIDWQNASTSGSRLVLLRYVERHPASIHAVEARSKIDSLDWITAAGLNTMKAYQTYMDDHTDGQHYPDAKMNYEKLRQRMVSSDDEHMLTQLFANFFAALGRNDESGLRSTLAPVMGSFLRRQGATQADVVIYMRQMHDDEDISEMNFLVNNDWKINKIENIDTGQMEYSVTFSANQHIVRTDPEKERKAVYKVSARVSPEGQIVDLNLRKVIK